MLDSSAWFHPNVEGQAQIADDLAAEWTALKSVQTDSPVKSAAVAGWTPIHLPDGIPDTAEAEFMLLTLATTNTELAGYNSGASYWNFTSKDGCDTRNQVLRKQAVLPSEFEGAKPLVPAAGSSSLCPVTGGSWQTPYDAAETPQDFTDQADIGAGIEIDHIVPKEDSWDNGAGNWMNLYGTTVGQQELSLFTNDTSNPELLAVSASSNASKGSQNPAEWMPTNTGMTCPYIKAWIEVKFEYTLTVSTVVTSDGQSEESYLTSALKSC